MKSYHQTLMSQIKPKYISMRNSMSLITVLWLIQYFKCQNILELGFYQGQTFGIMLESTDAGSSLTAVEIDYKLDLYNRYYANSEFVKDKTVNLVSCSSAEFCPSTKYDFINVDTGCELNTAEGQRQRMNDLINAFQWIARDGIVMLDNYNYYNRQDITDVLDLGHDFVPFLSDTQAVYFHHKAHDASDFLDNFLEQSTNINIVASLNNVDYVGFLIKEIKNKPVSILEHDELFSLFCNLKKV